jgi:hypothetical protein
MGITMDDQVAKVLSMLQKYLIKFLGKLTARSFFIQYDILETGKRDNLPIRGKKLSQSQKIACGHGV